MNSEVDGLPPRIKEILYRAGLIKCKSILETQECHLLNLAGITLSDVKLIYSVAAKQGKPSEFITGDQLISNPGRRWSSLSTGCTHLDKVLNGGILCRGITEISGHSGCGKTQLCLQLAISTQLPLSSGGLAAGAAFICTEDRFPSVRLNQLVKSCPVAQKFPDIQFGNNIFIEHVADSADLRKCVDDRLPQLVKNKQIGLVVIDSVTAVFRADYTPAEALQRARDLRAFANQLHLLANSKNIAVVCVNQVSDVKRGEKTLTVPALGLAWANLVTCRLQMTRNNNFRQLHVIFAPHLSQRSCQYNITTAGVVGIESCVNF